MLCQQAGHGSKAVQYCFCYQGSPCTTATEQSVCWCAESMDGNPAMAAAYLDSLTHSADARGHVMASMGTAQGAGMHMGFMEGHVPMDGLPLSVLEQLTQEHVALP